MSSTQYGDVSLQELLNQALICWALSNYADTESNYLRKLLEEVQMSQSNSISAIVLVKSCCIALIRASLVFLSLQVDSLESMKKQRRSDSFDGSYRA